VRRVHPVLRSGALRESDGPRIFFAMETFVIGLIALGCLAYLVCAVLRPDKF
jgi:K+-transporting ATPase KdpF subunit